MINRDKILLVKNRSMRKQYLLAIEMFTEEYFISEKDRISAAIKIYQKRLKLDPRDKQQVHKEIKLELKLLRSQLRKIKFILK